MSEQTIADENKILRGYLRDILDIVGHGSTFSDDCPAEMLAGVPFGVTCKITEKDEIIAEKEAVFSELRSLNLEQSDRIAELESDLAECQINLREADAKSTSTTDKYGLMLGRIGQMIPVEFYRTPESTVEQAVALLLERYYSEMATIAYNQNQKLENQ